MRKTNISLIIILAVFYLGTANAAIVNTIETTITQIIAYDDFGGGDVAIVLDTGLLECPNGGYLNPNSPGYKTLVSFALTAYTTGKTVLLAVYSDRIWTGGLALCEVDAIWLR